VVELGGVPLLLGAMELHLADALVQTCGCWALLALIRKGDAERRDERLRNAVLRAGER